MKYSRVDHLLTLTVTRSTGISNLVGWASTLFDERHGSVVA